MIGFIAERRPTLRTSYGYLTLRNGVPIGYVQADVLWRCVDLAFNTFDTFRGHDSAAVLGRTMAMLRHQFDATSFTLEPYQLGEGNDEGIQSGAWWFYYKLGFRPRNRLIRSVVTTELERMERNPGIARQRPHFANSPAIISISIVREPEPRSGPASPSLERKSPGVRTAP